MEEGVAVVVLPEAEVLLGEVVEEVSVWPLVDEDGIIVELLIADGITIDGHMTPIMYMMTDGIFLPNL